jgi:L-ribulose-5-phosphate 4-epimerase
MLQELKSEVLMANLELTRLGLDVLSFGSVSGICRSEGLIAIKPRGMKCEDITINDIVIVDMEGHLIEGNMQPSSETLTHLELYKAFPGIGGVSHSHSTYATMYAQACNEIPCLGTTHANIFYGNIPVTRNLEEHELTDYERNTGRVIIERFAGKNVDMMPAVLVAGHAPYCWGKNAYESVKNSYMLEYIARLAWGTLIINPEKAELPEHVLIKHYKKNNGLSSFNIQKKTAV